MANTNEPLYMQIYKQLREDILAMKYPAGKRLPTEKELCKIYHVSRITAKNALNMLAEDKLIVRIKGKGSFVSHNQALHTIDNKQGNAQKTIGVIIPEFEDIYGRDMLAAIEKHCRKHGFLCMICRSEESQQVEAQALDNMIQHGVAGIIIMPVFGVYYNAKILQLVLDAFPVVLVDRDLRGIPVHFVGTDNITAAETAMDYLIQAGHKKIGVYASYSKNTSSVEDRIEGIHRSLHKNNLLLEPSLFYMMPFKSALPNYGTPEIFGKDREAAIKHMKENQGMTAAIAMGYKVALVVRSAAEKLGLKVPEDIQIVCFDGPKQTPLGEYHFTHMRQNQEDMGRKAVELILSLLNGNIQENTVKINLSASLICAKCTQ